MGLPVTNQEVLARRIDSLRDDIAAVHETLGTLIDDVNEFDQSVRIMMAQLSVRVRRLEEANGHDHAA